jgi:hypothetical protein
LDAVFDGLEMLLDTDLETGLGMGLETDFVSSLDDFVVEKALGEPFGDPLGDVLDPLGSPLESPLTPNDPGAFREPFLEGMGSLLDLVFMLRERASSSFVMDADIGCTHPSHVLFFCNLNAVHF